MMPEPQIVTVTNTVKTTVPIVARPKGAQINNIIYMLLQQKTTTNLLQSFQQRTASLHTLLLVLKTTKTLV